MERSQETKIAAPGDEQPFEDSSQLLSRSDSNGSVWSSADVPLFFDGRNSSDALRVAGATLPSGPSSCREGSSVSLSSRPSMELNNLLDSVALGRRFGSRAPSSHFAHPWGHHAGSISTGPRSPRLSHAESAASSEVSRAPTDASSKSSAAEGDEALLIAMPQHSLLDVSPRSHRSSQSSARGFKLKKPATLQVTPIAFSSLLRPSNSVITPTTGPLSSDRASTISPSLGTSPARSHDTHLSTELATPLTDSSLHLRNSRLVNTSAAPEGQQRRPRTDTSGSSSSSGRQHGSLYSRAEQFFKVDYTMSTSSLGTGSSGPSIGEERRDRDVNTSAQRNEELAMLPARSSLARARASTASQPTRSSFCTKGPRSDDVLPTVRENGLVSMSDLVSQSETEGLGVFDRLSPVSPQLEPRGWSTRTSGDSRNLLPPRGSPVVIRIEQPDTDAFSTNMPRCSLFEQTISRSPLRSPRSPPSDFNPSLESSELSRTASRESNFDTFRLRALSVPKLSPSWIGQEGGSLVSTRQASLSVGDSARFRPHGPSQESVSPAHRFAQLRPNLRSELVSEECSTSGPSRATYSSCVGTALSRSSSQRSRRGSAASLSVPQSAAKRLARSSSRPRTKGDWSSYLSEGLMLYVDQGALREVALKMPYLSYDPFGRSESLVAANGSPPGAGKKGPARLNSSGKGPHSGDDDVGLLEFARSDISGPLSTASFSITDSAPILRHLGIGEDTKADLLTRQAALSIEENGVHEVSGLERNGRVGWRLTYEVSSLYGGEQVPERILTPMSFVCSATLLDPDRARKGRFLKMIKKGVATNIASNLVQGSERIPSEAGSFMNAGQSSSGRNDLGLTADGQPLSPRHVIARSSGSQGGHREEGSFNLAHDYRLPSPVMSPARRTEPNRARTPPSLPHGVNLFHFNGPRESSGLLRFSTSIASPTSRNGGQMYDEGSHHVTPPHPTASPDHHRLRRPSLGMFRSDEAFAPTRVMMPRDSYTAAEEIKMAYLRSTLEREEAAAAAAAAAVKLMAAISSPTNCGGSGSSSSGGCSGDGSASHSSTGTVTGTGTVNSWPRFMRSRGDSPSSPSSTTRASPLHQHFEARDSRTSDFTGGASSPTLGKSNRSSMRKALSAKVLPRTPREEKHRSQTGSNGSGIRQSRSGADEGGSGGGSTCSGSPRNLPVQSEMMRGGPATGGTLGRRTGAEVASSLEDQGFI